MIKRLAGCLLLLAGALHAGAIDASVAHTIFFRQGDKLGPSIELYWQVNPRKLHYTTTPEKTIVARIKTDITFSNDTGIISEHHFISQTAPRKDAGELSSLSILEIRNYALPTGLVRMKFELTDNTDPSNRFTYTDSFTISQPSNTAYYSDLKLLDTSLPATTPTPFTRNGRQQIPLCATFLDNNKRVLHYYAELYATDQLPEQGRPYVQHIGIAKKEQEYSPGSFMRTDTLQPQKTNIASGSFDIAALTSGNYYLNISLEDNTHSTVASKSLFFQRLNTHPAAEKVDTATKKDVLSDSSLQNVTVLNLDKTFISKYTLAQVKAILKMMLPISDPMEANTISNFLKKPEEMYMRYYIYNHFAAINKQDPGKAWKEYSEKVKEVNRKFTYQGTAGYETERGFIYLRYGAPSEVITVNNETGSLPYEIWQYNTLTQMNRKAIVNAVFLFYKPSQMLNDYRLLHSTVSGEAVNMAWRSYLYTSDNTGVNTTSRADQYIGNR